MFKESDKYRNFCMPRKEIIEFSEWMEFVMRGSDEEKGDTWRKMDLELLEEKLFEEVSEFLEEIQLNDATNDKALECVDIANVAMMLFHRYYELWKKKWK